MPQQPQHDVSIVIGGTEIPRWTEYEIEALMTTPANGFRMTRPFGAQAYRVCVPDAKIRVRIDGVTVLDGFIDSRHKSTDGSRNEMTIQGRSRAARMVQESAPTVGFDGLDLLAIAKRLADPWFTTIATSNARNRNVQRGRGRKAVAATEPLVLKARRKTWQVEPGQSRWKILNDLCSEAGYMLWPSGDGKELIIGQPNYAQAVQWLVANPAPGSTVDQTAVRLDFDESVADRFSMIVALGAAAGDSVNYGSNVTSHRGVAKNGPGIDGTGLDFTYPKRLILSEHSAADLEEADAIAAREMARRDFSKLQVTATVRSHGQIVGGTTPTIFTYDTLARVIDEEQDLPFDQVMYVYGCTYRSRRETGEQTELKLVPKGTVFVL